MIVLAKLFLAHCLGDFFLQTDYMLEQKEAKGWRSPMLYVHVLIHFGLMVLLLSDMPDKMWAIAGSIAGTHLIIDAAKVRFQTPETKRAWFFWDQGLHLAAILGLWWLFFTTQIEGEWGIHWDPMHWYTITAFVLITQPASYLVGKLLANWAASLDEETADALKGAGKFIGILERLFVLSFVLLGEFRPIGFFLAAKSVFRFGDLNNARSLKLTEYVLVGTLLSFALAVAAGLVLTKVFGICWYDCLGNTRVD